MSIINLSGKEVKVDISGTDFSVSDEQGKVYSSEELWWQEGMSSEDCYPNQLSDFYLKSLKAGERKDIAIRVVLSEQSASANFQITVYRAGPIRNAKWSVAPPIAQPPPGLSLIHI